MGEKDPLLTEELILFTLRWREERWLLVGQQHWVA